MSSDESKRGGASPEWCENAGRDYDPETGFCVEPRSRPSPPPPPEDARLPPPPEDDTDSEPEDDTDSEPEDSEEDAGLYVLMWFFTMIVWLVTIWIVWKYLGYVKCRYSESSASVHPSATV